MLWGDAHQHAPPPGRLLDGRPHRAAVEHEIEAVEESVPSQGRDERGVGGERTEPLPKLCAPRHVVEDVVAPDVVDHGEAACGRDGIAANGVDWN